VRASVRGRRQRRSAGGRPNGFRMRIDHDHPSACHRSAGASPLTAPRTMPARCAGNSSTRPNSISFAPYVRPLCSIGFCSCSTSSPSSIAPRGTRFPNNPSPPAEGSHAIAAEGRQGAVRLPQLQGVSEKRIVRAEPFKPLSGDLASSAERLQNDSTPDRLSINTLRGQRR